MRHAYLVMVEQAADAGHLVDAAAVAAALKEAPGLSLCGVWVDSADCAMFESGAADEVGAVADATSGQA